MSTQKISLFGALVAVGGVLAWRWGQNRRRSQIMHSRDLTRWEGEGGSPAGGLEAEPLASVSDAPADGASGEAWPFPHGG
ncbi:hypothetical protein CY652_22805 [Burkholderia sp. WAC0059]|uniref:hypothetical protein n=1 Tax=Burkholderia sp. WAC0059 TaxID=2066022 RepID=UPI000C7ED8A0|nr:hypothetical protein [Burkholderia sp. WAC0059]PLZ00119.1 hypothetical protein CY652_22805 [Burkholderia sp. WAC0059]